MDLIIHQKDALEPDQVGGKAAALNRLASFGFEPPAFFVISPDAFRQSGDKIIATSGLKAALIAGLKTLGAGPFAVRSSGRAEDGIEHSHAGQFDSILNVPAGGVMDAAKQVWASGFSDTVATYRATMTGGAAEAPAMIVQKMIEARASGVAFSADPVTGQRGRVIISAISGLGDRLVAGEVDGEDWCIEDADVVQSPDDPDALTEADALAVADLARKVEAAFGMPQDIEWAFHDTQLHILQARPITTKLRPLENTDNALIIFDNSNIVESYPGLVSPLTYSFAQYAYARVYRAFVRLLGVSDSKVAENAAVFDNMLGRIDGRVYYNLVNWYRALALLPGFALNRDHMETMMGLSVPLPESVTAGIGPPPVHGFAKALEYLRMGRVGFGLLWQAIRLPRTIRGFYIRLNVALESSPKLDDMNLTELAADYRAVESQLLDRWDAPLVNDFLCMIAFGATRKMLEKWLGPEGLLLHNDVMIGQGDIISAEPPQRIAVMGNLVRDAGIAEQVAAQGRAAFDTHPKIAAKFDDYLVKFGDRCTQELKLESIPLTDDPTSLLAAIAASAEHPPKAHVEAREPDWATLFKGHPIRKHFGRWVIGWTKARVRDRENLRFERTRIFGHARRVLLAMGRELSAIGKLDNPRDIFFLTVNEILGAIEGFGMTQDLKPLVALRRGEDAASATRPDPAERIEIKGAAIKVANITAIAEKVFEGEIQTATGCSAGVVQATARVIRDPRSESLKAGDILIARHTDPGWIAVFSNASAIVVERGSLLSHSAIVAREMGIPCVVGLKGATDWIKDGDLIEVDGAAGIVRKIT